MNLTAARVSCLCGGFAFIAMWFLRLHKEQTHPNDTDDSTYDFAQGHLLMEKDGCWGDDENGRERKERLGDAR